jgi:RHH-type transcriptional regulator, proline utilization regulon repressor / proline dehydrogenase / delta 1-pyrroline-5-carboxylate dehydrogenase
MSGSWPHSDGDGPELPGDDAVLARAAVRLAGQWLKASAESLRRTERRQSAQLARMMKDPGGRAFTLALADQVFRPLRAARAADQFRYLVRKHGVPDYLPLAERAALWAGAAASLAAPGVVMPAVTEAMRRQSSAVILPAEEARLKPVLRCRREAGMRMNLNQLGEAVLGEEEAERRLEAAIARLSGTDCDCLSVKISAICSQIHLVGHEETLCRIAERLRRLYRAALRGGRKMVNLDMEEYRDLSLTVEAFRRVLDEAEFRPLVAGIALQAYLPDSWPVQRELTQWARERVASGGAPIRIRIVKGANLAMERVDAELHGWPQAPYASKEEVDANFKRMLHEGCRRENAAAVRIGVASHNLFDLAYAMLLREREGVTEWVEFEMLEGMANHQARVLRAAAGDLLLYAPVVRRNDFHSAMAYLVRRLDENTAEENFLHDLFGMQEGDAAWEDQKQRFLAACVRKDEVAAGPRRTQDRAREMHEALPEGVPFRNAPDTDWSLAPNVRWIRRRVEELRDQQLAPVPLVIAGEEEDGEFTAGACDPSRPGRVAYRYALAGPRQVERALAAAVVARGAWSGAGFAKRAGLLRRAAAEMSADRGGAIATMVLDAGKAVTEADGEVSEAIDFANYYASSIRGDGAVLEPLGTVVVTPPWNFPYAIPCSGVLAALVAGNTVILKPAPETVLTAWTMMRALWRAGIPREVLQFLPCPDDEVGRALVTDERVGAVVLTGAFETAEMFLKWRPEMRLNAETSGKNALVITAAADLDLAVKDLVRSAFGHAGQKCSAASLAIVEAEVYDSPDFRRQLRDAAASLVVGGAWDFDAAVTPVIREPGDELRRGLSVLDEGEEWLLEPGMVGGNPCLWSPGIRLGVQPGSWFHRTECFGPVLGVMRAVDFADALRLQNDSAFGLTGGIHSLDDREVTVWKEQVEVGNAYVNRPITGAIVERQPFGGWKRSCFGSGAKAGGPNYVAQFGRWRNVEIPAGRAEPAGAAKDLLGLLMARLPGEVELLQAVAGSDAFWAAREFGISQDPAGLGCEANVFRYRKFPRAIVRADSEVADGEVARLLLAAAAMGVELEVSVDARRGWLEGMAGIRVEGDEQLVARLGTGPAGVLRCPVGAVGLKTAAVAAGWRWADGPVLWSARWEWPAWLREQAVSETRHRYGNRVGFGEGGAGLGE